MTQQTSPEVEQFLLAKVDGTDLTRLAVYAIGESLLNWIAVTALLGHQAPGHALDYVDETDGPIRDFVAWTSGRPQLAPGCAERLTDWISTTGWARHRLAACATSLGLQANGRAAS